MENLRNSMTAMSMTASDILCLWAGDKKCQTKKWIRMKWKNKTYVSYTVTVSLILLIINQQLFDKIFLFNYIKRLLP